MARNLIALICGISLAWSDIFILSFKAQVKNAQIIHQSFHASKSMMQTQKHPFKSLTLYLDKPCQRKHFFKCYQDEIAEYIISNRAIIHAYDSVQNLQGQSFSELIVKPVYVQVDFNDTFAKISLLK